MSSKKAKQEKGAARIQQLAEMFLELPRLQVVKSGYQRKGIRHTVVLDQVGRWT